MKWLVAVLAFAVAGWMAFDGSRALIVGDYVTPESGRYAGQLGPWSNVVAAVGIDPRSTLMKWIFAVYGVTWITVIVAFVLDAEWARAAMVIAAAGALWYLPFGALLGIVQLAILLWPSSRAP